MKSVSRKIVSILTLALTISFLITSLSMYNSVYNKTLTSAGIEAYGCANITTGLIDYNDLEKALTGDQKVVDKLQSELDWTVDHKHIFRNQYVLDLKGKVIAMDSKTNPATGVSIGDMYPVNQGFIDEVITTKAPTYSDIYKVNNESTLTGFAPIFKNHDGKQEVVAISAIDFDGGIVKERTFEIINGTLLMSGIPLIFVIVMSFFFINKIIRPIRTVSEKLIEINNGDLTVRLDVNSNDEIGVLANNLNKLTESFQGILEEVSFNSIQLAATSEELLASTHNISSISNQNTIGLKKVNDMSKAQLDHTDEINSIIQSLSIKIQEVSEQLNNFSQISKQTVQESISGIDAMDETNHQMNNIHQAISNLSETMLSLEDKSKQIDQIIDFVNETSEDINILSFNAAIEAARAGEYGKGFAVVADEVRKLAEDSRKSTKEIRDLLGKIQLEINEALSGSEESNKKTIEGIDKVSQSETLFRKISDQIKLADGDFEVSSHSVESVANELEEIVQKMGEVANLVRNTTDNTTDVSNAINDQNNSFNEIVEVTDNLASLSDTLKERISFFKISDEKTNK